MGWGRDGNAGLEKAFDNLPAVAIDFWRLFDEVIDNEKRTDECILTFKQVTDALTDDVVCHIVSVLLEQGVHEGGIVGMLTRIASLAKDPVAVLKRPLDIIKTVYVPVQRGFTNGTVDVLEYASGIISKVIGEPYDVVIHLQPPVTNEQPPAY